VFDHFVRTILDLVLDSAFLVKMNCHWLFLEDRVWITGGAKHKHWPSILEKERTIMIEAEGKVFQWEGLEKIRPDFLETFDFDSPRQYIKTETHEFIAACPFSGLPDVGRLIIEYYPEGGRCIELKSLKYYVVSFKNVGLFQEGVTKRIFDDLRAVLKTQRLKVTTIYNTRGGFDTTCIEGDL